MHKIKLMSLFTIKLNNFIFIYRDVAFILADPFVIDMLARNAMSLLNRCVQNELLPRVIKQAS